MEYIETAYDIFNWLKALQVSDNQESAETEASATQVSLNNYGGIRDPIENDVIRDHYAATHFALLGALLYRREKNDQILDATHAALRFHVNSLQHPESLGEEYTHWDFKNYAFALTFQLLEPFTNADDLKVWRSTLLNTTENSDNRLSNWISMRALFVLLRYNLFHQPLDRMRFEWRIRKLDWARQYDGGYDDEVNRSRPIQYHVFVLALLHRMYLLKRSKYILTRFVQGVRFFLPFIDSEGGFNYLGRGQQQIFGYAAALYVLEAARKVLPGEKKRLQFLSEKMWTYLLSFKGKDHFPLVLNAQPDEERVGWYDYHFLSVYNAFAGAWLGLTDQIKSTARQNSTDFYMVQDNIIFRHSRIIHLNNGSFKLIFSWGQSSYLSEPCISPVYFWIKDFGTLFSCPGGPSEMHYGKKYAKNKYRQNFFAPLLIGPDNYCDAPVGGYGKFRQLTPHIFEFIYPYSQFILKRTVTLQQSHAVFCDTFEFDEKTEIYELRYFNLPVLKDKFSVDNKDKNELVVTAGKNKAAIKILQNDFKPHFFKTEEEQLSAGGQLSIIGFMEAKFKISGQEKKVFKFQIGCNNAGFSES